MLPAIFASSPMCIVCKRHTRDTYIKHGALSLCSACFRLFREAPPLSSANTAYMFAAYTYGNAMRGAIADFKFRSNPAYADILAELTAEVFERKGFPKECDFIIPMPLHPMKQKMRGFNHTELLLDKINERLGLLVRCDALIRIKNTLPQSRLTGTDRIKNVENAFLAAEDMTGKRMVIFDDVITTGLTAESAASALIRAGAKSVGVLATAAAIQKNTGICCKTSSP